MSFLAFILIVISAIMHASWNLLAKKNHMTLPFYAALCTGGAVIWLNVQFWTPIHIWSLPFPFWAFLFLSVASDFLYCFSLIQIYARLDMVTAYPVMRAMPIIFTALVTAACGWGTPLTKTTLIGFFIVVIGALMMPLKQLSDFKLRNYWNLNSIFLLSAALGTTGYTVFDSQAQKIMLAHSEDISNTVRSLSYYSTRAIFLSSSLWITALCSAKDRSTIREYLQERNSQLIWAGLIASSTYVLVLIAMQFVTNVSFVQVFRQLGLPIGMLFGVIFLKERCTRIKVTGVLLILTGLALSVIKFH